MSRERHTCWSLALSAVLAPTTAMSQAASAGHAATPFPYVSESLFVSAAVAEQSVQIRNAALERLRKSYPELGTGRFEMGASGRARRTEEMLNNRLIATVVTNNPGITYKETRGQTLVFSPDWYVAGSIVPANPSDFTLDIKTTQTSFLGSQLAVPPVSELEPLWNCSPTPQKVPTVRRQRTETT